MLAGYKPRLILFDTGKGMPRETKEKAIAHTCSMSSSSTLKIIAFIAIIPAPGHQTLSGRARGERRWRRFLKTSGVVARSGFASLEQAYRLSGALLKVRCQLDSRRLFEDNARPAVLAAKVVVDGLF